MSGSKKLIIGTVCLLIIGGGIAAAREGVKSPDSSSAAPTTLRPTNDEQLASFDKGRYSLKDPSSLWVIVNKQNPLQPQEYTPVDLMFPDVPLRVPDNETMQLRASTSRALKSMFTDASKQNLKLMVASGYRSYTYQSNLYNRFVQSMGQTETDKQSARPGFSEHQTGLAVDIEPADRSCELELCFGDSAEGKWLAVNAYTYGFILRYPEADTAVTGYQYEPWHFRYVGTELSNEMYKRDVKTLEGFFDIKGGTEY